MRRVNGGRIGNLNTPAQNNTNGFWSLAQVQEYKQNGNWPIYGFEVEYLVVAGGGGGTGSYYYYGGGGGGGGGVLTSSRYVDLSTNYVITVGAGGTGQTGNPGRGYNGNPSSIGSVVLAYGGAYGSAPTFGPSYTSAALDMGSGGGRYGPQTDPTNTYNPAQGNYGGIGTSNSGAGGGGWGATGGNSNSQYQGGSGGNGGSSSISGSSVTYAGGGGGGCARAYGNASTPSGGSGGGGNGGNPSAGSGSGNTGGGGGGGGSEGSATVYPGGNGGSGIVIIRYLGSQRATGGTITTSGGYTIHTFTSSGTFAT